MRKKKLVGFVVLACIAFCFGFLALPRRVASADVGATIKDFQMEYGASVRIGEKDGKDGIRFTATLPASVYETLEELETETCSVSYGMLIVPADYTQEESKTYTAALNRETLFGNNAKYTVTDCTPTIGDNTCTCEKRHISCVTYEALSGTNETKFLRGSLVDLKERNRMRAFIGLGYIQYTSNGISEYFLAENAKNQDGTGEANIENNTRSMSYVAQLAIADGQDDTSETLYKQYVQPFENTSYKYEVWHYLPDISEPIVQSLYAPLGEEVTAKHISETEEYAQYATYTLDEENENAHMQDVVYANGKTVLRCYYIKETTDIERKFSFETEEEAQKYLAIKTQLGVTPSISYTEEKQSKSGVAVYSTKMTGYGAYGAYFNINLSEYEEEILKAFSDDTLTFSMQIDMLISARDVYMKDTLTLFNIYEVQATIGIWQTVTIDEKMLKEALTDETKIRNCFEGIKYLFYVVDGMSSNEEVIYYVDCITYTISKQ